ncbi:MAG: gamma-glutamylcyclotransferase [Candidatus Omnitrophota bacterium]|jgi:gamma-glutamylcyclotransferase (GGCT)/AIG2-like uncharacterized protein YtfP|nr:MAG: gamma-glutamylcyclotransferase [Candidatus Omnitrophota bacterium]
MERIRYFAYGHYIDPWFLHRLDIRFNLQLPAILPGYQLVFNVLEDVFFRFEKRGLANITPRAGCEVEGLIYDIDETELPRLDLAAGVKSLKYYRKKVYIRQNGIGQLEAITYAAWPDVTAEGLLPSNRYLQSLINAAGRQGISPTFCNWLANHPSTV